VLDDVRKRPGKGIPFRASDDLMLKPERGYSGYLIDHAQARAAASQ
jgi:hypothetical protein